MNVLYQQTERPFT